MGSGIYGQYVYVDAARDVVLAKLSSLPRPLDPTIAADTLSAFAEPGGAPGGTGLRSRELRRAQAPGEGVSALPTATSRRPCSGRCSLR